jgi:hypothetical protein
LLPLREYEQRSLCARLAWTVVLVVSVKKDGGVVIIDHASFAHRPVLMV